MVKTRQQARNEAEAGGASKSERKRGTRNQRIPAAEAAMKETDPQHGPIPSAENKQRKPKKLAPALREKAEDEDAPPDADPPALPEAKRSKRKAKKPAENDDAPDVSEAFLGKERDVAPAKRGKRASKAACVPQVHPHDAEDALLAQPPILNSAEAWIAYGKRCESNELDSTEQVALAQALVRRLKDTEPIKWIYLAQMYFHGWGVERDVSRARRYYARHKEELLAIDPNADFSTKDERFLEKRSPSHTVAATAPSTRVVAVT